MRIVSPGLFIFVKTRGKINFHASFIHNYVCDCTLFFSELVSDVTNGQTNKRNENPKYVCFCILFALLHSLVKQLLVGFMETVSLKKHVNIL